MTLGHCAVYPGPEAATLSRDEGDDHDEPGSRERARL
jgi:hypothetical protein